MYKDNNSSTNTAAAAFGSDSGSSSTDESSPSPKPGTSHGCNGAAIGWGMRIWRRIRRNIDPRQRAKRQLAPRKHVHGSRVPPQCVTADTHNTSDVGAATQLCVQPMRHMQDRLSRGAYPHHTGHIYRISETLSP